MSHRSLISVVFAIWMATAFAWAENLAPAVTIPMSGPMPGDEFQHPYKYIPPMSEFFPDPPWNANVLADSLTTSNPPDGALWVTGQGRAVASWNHLVGNFVWRVAVTTDGGVSWTPSTILSTGTQFDNDGEGNKRDTSICLVMKQVTGGYNLYFKMSTNSGVSWLDTVHVPQSATGTFPDYPKLPTSTKGRYLLVTYYNAGGNGYEGIARSTNWGQTWNATQQYLSNATGQGGSPAFDPRPTSNMAYAAWGQPADWNPPQVWFNRSTDLGATWTTPRNIFNVNLSSTIGRSRPNHTFPVLIVDGNGKLYLTIQNRMTGTGYDAAVYTSTDMGTTWRGPVQINDGNGGNADSVNAHCLIPNITIDRYNRPHVFWYDNRRYSPTLSWDVYYTYSNDGGLTWARNERINDVTPIATSVNMSQMGDFQQIDCDDTRLYCEWSDHRNGRNSWSYIATATRLLPPVGVEEKPTGNPWVQGRFNLEDSRPNPVMHGTELAFQIEKSSHATLKVYDLTGKLVRTVINGSLPAGSHTAKWDARDETGKPVSSGVYFYRLESAGLTATKKLIVTR